HVAARLQPVDRGRGGVHRLGGGRGGDRRGDADLPRSRLAGCREGAIATDPRRARGGDRARGREPRTAQAHDGARDYAWARASAVESRRGGERDEAHRGAGLVAGSVALTGFGIDSVIEVASGVVLWWRLRAELGAARVGPIVEARAARWAGVLLLALAVYIVAESGRRLFTGDRPGESVV